MVSSVSRPVVGAGSDIEGAKRLFFEALELIDRNDLSAGELTLRRAHALAPGIAVILQNLCIVQLQQGKTDDAIESAKACIALAPSNVEARLVLARCLANKGEYDEALEMSDRAVELAPEDAAAHNHRGVVLLRIGRDDEALAALRRAVTLSPSLTEAHANLGLACEQTRAYAEALAAYETALHHDPRSVNARLGRANALSNLGRHDEAAAEFDEVLARDHQSVEARVGLGNVFARRKEFERALGEYDTALSHAPAAAIAWVARGNALRELRRCEEAFSAYDRAIDIQPKTFPAWIGRGNVLFDQGNFESSLASYGRALELRPTSPEAWHFRADALKKMERHGEALQSYSKLASLAPDYDFAKGYLLHQKMICCDWSDLASLSDTIRDDVRAGRAGIEPFAYQAVSSSARDLKSCAEIYVARLFPGDLAMPAISPRLSSGRIRLGYVSGEFRQQATALLLTGVFEQHDRTRFELFAIDNGWDDGSEQRKRIDAAFDGVLDIRNLGDREAATLIREHGIDILVNLNGFFGEGRTGVFSLRPAAIQVNYLGFPGTIGAGYMDYIVADRHVIPPEHDGFYCEKVVRLPDTYQANDARRSVGSVTVSRLEVGLPEHGFVFCCFNNNYKIVPEMFSVWMELLRSTDRSVLWLLQDNKDATENLQREAASRGIAPERIVFAPRMAIDYHLARHRIADLFLDTLPYNAHTTASDALWAGLPLVTCRGTTFPGRVAASLLSAVGLPEMVTQSLEDYAALAKQLAQEPATLAAIRAKLMCNRGTHPLFDTERFTRHMEAAYLAMWERHRSGQAPVALDIAPI